MIQTKGLGDKGLMLLSLFGVDFAQGSALIDEEFDQEITCQLTTGKLKGISDLIVGIHIEETVPYSFMKDFLPKLTQLLKEKVSHGYIKKFVTFRNTGDSDQYASHNFQEENHVVLEWMVSASAVKTRYLGYDKFEWNPNADKILLMSSQKLHKENRMLPFIISYQHHKEIFKHICPKKRVLDSYNIFAGYDDSIKRFYDSLVYFISNKEYASIDDFLHKVENNNFTTEQNLEYNTTDYTFPPIDIINNYNDVCVEYSTESFWRNPTWLTEKTARSLCSGYPAFYDNHRTKEYLEGLGFITYNHLITESTSSAPWNSYSTGLNQLLANVTRTIENCIMFRDAIKCESMQTEVKKIIAHNKENSIKVYQQQVHRLNSFLSSPLSEDQALRIFASCEDLGFIPEFSFRNFQYDS